MISRRASAAIGVIAVCALCWLLAQSALWLHLSDQARADRQIHRSGHSQLQFNLSTPTDLIGGRALDVQAQSFSTDGLRLDLAPGAANVPIGFDGRCLSAQKFPRMSLELQSSQPLKLALVHSPTAGGEQRVSEIALAKGAHTLNLDLRELNWWAGQQPRGLGDSSGRLCEFRLVPVVNQPTDLQLSQLRFSLDENAPAALAWSDAIALPARWQRPESVLRQRDQSRTHADREIWPDSLPQEAETAASKPRHWPASLAISLSLIAVVLATLRRNSMLVVSMALTGPITLLASNRLAEGSSLIDWLSVVMSAALLLYLGASTKQSRINLLGGASAWREALQGVTIVLLLALLVHRLAGQPAIGWPDTSDLLRYFAWAAIQQTLLQRVLIPNLNGATNAWTGALPAATAFALLHTPNFSLMLLCLLAGLWWSSHYARHRSWLPLVAAHAVLGATLPLFLPLDWLYSAEVGARFFTAPAG